MEKELLVTIIIAVLIVSIFVSIATTSLTGDVIRVTKTVRGGTEIYTKAEIDVFIAKINERLDKLEDVETNETPSEPICQKTCSKVLRLSNIKNQSQGYSSDYVKFTDLKDGEVYDTVFTSEGLGILSLDGLSYKIELFGAHTLPTEEMYIKMTSPSNQTWKTFGGQYLILSPTGNGQTDCKENCVSVYGVLTISNSSNGYSNDAVRLFNAKTTEVYETVILSEGVGTIAIGGKAYNLKYFGSSNSALENRYIELTTPEGKTSKIFYKNYFTI